jgi:Ser/Thr protein kinase RdoA (MazF antagonist)
MDELAILATVQHALGEHYGQSDCSLHSLNTRSLDDERIVYKMYRVDVAGKPSCVVFAAHDELTAGRTFRWETDVMPMVWLEQRAMLLNALASQAYPVPRVIRALSGECVVRCGSWSFLVTTFIDGRVSQFVPEALSQAGTILARLHTLPLDAMPCWPSLWNTVYSIPHAIQELERVTTSLPPSHQTFYHACHTTLHTILHALPTLPEVLIHGDCWMQNAVVTNAGVVFIDWESAGRGTAILDLAGFLLRSQCDAYGAPPSAVRAPHVIAAVCGYAFHRIPSESELDLLVEAMRFSEVWRAAWMFTRVRSEGWTPGLEQGLASVQATYNIAEQTANIARSAFHEFRMFVS